MDHFFYIDGHMKQFFSTFLCFWRCVIQYFVPELTVGVKQTFKIYLRSIHICIQKNFNPNKII